MLKKAQTPAYFGLDIGTRALRAVQLELGSNQKPSLVAHGMQELPADLVSIGSEGDKSRLGELITQLRDGNDISADSVVISLPAQHFKATVLSVEPDADPAERVYEVMSQQLQRAANDISVDWHEVSHSGAATGKQVFAVAAAQDVVQKYVNVIENTGLQLRALEVDAVALSRSVVYDPSWPVLVLDFGQQETQVAVIWKRIPYSSYSVAAGTQVFTDAIAQNLNVDTEQATQFLKQYGASSTKLEGQVLRAMQEPLQAVIRQVKNSIEEFAELSSEVEVGKIVMSGTATSVPEVPVYIADNADLPVEIANPWINISYPATQHEQLMNYSAQFAVASGLALREFV